jgi:hypothetical protein
MLLVTIHLSVTDAYNLLVNLYSYSIVAVFGFAVALGLLKLRFSSRERWRQKSSFNPYLSILCAFIFAIASAYPIVASWVPPSAGLSQNATVAWFTVPTVAWSILAVGVIWYLGFNLYAARRARKEGVEFEVQKVPEFDRDPPPDGPPVQVHETVFLAWVAKENYHPSVEMVSRSSRESF